MSTTAISQNFQQISNSKPAPAMLSCDPFEPRAIHQIGKDLQRTLRWIITATAATATAVGGLERVKSGSLEPKQKPATFLAAGSQWQPPKPTTLRKVQSIHPSGCVTEILLVDTHPIHHRQEEVR
ncbi:MAG: hypothetical protein ACRD2L_18335, partial [Terriglobia bacterium]